MLRPWNTRINYFIHNVLLSEEGSCLGTSQKDDICFWVLRSQILKERRQHYDVAQIPVFDNEYAADFGRGIGTRQHAQMTQRRNNWAQDGIDQADYPPPPRPEFYQASEGRAVGVFQLCGFRNLNQINSWLIVLIALRVLCKPNLLKADAGRATLSNFDPRSDVGHPGGCLKVRSRSYRCRKSCNRGVACSSDVVHAACRGGNIHLPKIVVGTFEERHAFAATRNYQPFQRKIDDQLTSRPLHRIVGLINCPDQLHEFS